MTSIIHQQEESPPEFDNDYRSEGDSSSRSDKEIIHKEPPQQHLSHDHRLFFLDRMRFVGEPASIMDDIIADIIISPTKSMAKSDDGLQSSISDHVEYNDVDKAAESNNVNNAIVDGNSNDDSTSKRYKDNNNLVFPSKKQPSIDNNVSTTKMRIKESWSEEVF